MKKQIIASLIALGLCSGVFVVAQSTAFTSWPVLYDLAENLVVKQGVDEQGNAIDLLYFRVGWDTCLRVRVDEWADLAEAAPLDQYMNMRAYADSKFDNSERDQLDGVNCPSEPKIVKPTWRNSRPTYQFTQDGEHFVRGTKTAYRVETGPAYDCVNQRARKTDGSTTNYWRLAGDAIVYNSTGSSAVADLDFEFGLLAICSGTGVSIEDHHF